MSCSLKKEQDNSIITAQFNVLEVLLQDSSLVDSMLRMEIGVPREWHTADTILLQNLKHGILQNEYLNADISHCYISSIDSSMLLVVDVGDLDTSIYVNFKCNYQKLLNVNNIWANVQFHEFMHNDYRIEQYVMQNEEMRNFKLVCYSNSKHPDFELVYFINRREEKLNIQSVESSIGTLKHLTNKR
jgi:hypothetical protein